jgi:hypothetical protein
MKHTRKEREGMRERGGGNEGERERERKRENEREKEREREIMRERQIDRNIKRKTKPRNKKVKTPTIVKTMKTYLLLTKPPVKVHEFKQKDIILKWIDCQIMPVCSDSMSGKNKKGFFPEKTINFVYKK